MMFEGFTLQPEAVPADQREAASSNNWPVCIVPVTKKKKGEKNKKNKKNKKKKGAGVPTLQRDHRPNGQIDSPYLEILSQAIGALVTCNERQMQLLEHVVASSQAAAASTGIIDGQCRVEEDEVNRLK